MAVMNFGMDLRPTSQVVKTDDQLQLEYQNQMRALMDQQSRQQQTANDALSAYGLDRVSQARAQGFNVGDDYADIVRQAAQQQGNGLDLSSAGARFDIGDAARASGQTFKNAFSDLQATDQQQQQARTGYNDLVNARQQAAGTQQAAYNANTLAGGSQGGVLSSVAQQGTLDPTQMASWGTSWTQPGFGNLGSLGGLGGYGGKTSQPQQNGGWGGVFGNRNPWSAA